MTPRRMSFELIFAGALWGFSFVGQRLSQEFWTPIAALNLRFLIAVCLSLPLIFLLPALRRADHLTELKLAFWPGALLGITLFFQNKGINLTTISNSGFLTTLYVLWVPLLEALLLRRRVPRLQILLIGWAMIGMALLCQFHTLHFNRGDLWILLCSLTSAGQIACISRVGPKAKSPLLLNIYQSLWITVFAAIVLSFQRQPISLHAPLRSWLGLLHLSICATLIAFLIQIRAQRILSATTASLLFLLEAPFAAIFGYLILGERLALSQIFGAAIILSAAYATIRFSNETIREVAIESASAIL